MEEQKELIPVRKDPRVDNLTLFNSVRAVPNKLLKAFDNGTFKGTDINRMWRIETLTKEFGVCGFGRYYEVIHREMVTAPDGTISAFIGLNLYVKMNGEWSKPIYGEGGNAFVRKSGGKASDEAYKMALTDALGIAAKQLGVGADVWFACEKTKYTQEDQFKIPTPNSKVEIPDNIGIIRPEVHSFLANNESIRNQCFEKYGVDTIGDLSDEQLVLIKKAMDKKKEKEQ